MSRESKGGEDIKLRVRFLDDLNNNATASGIHTYIFDPLTDTDILNEAIEDGEPTDLGNGIYEYVYSIPDYGPEGTWHDRWQGWLNGQLLDEEFAFSVLTSGIIEDFPTQLFNNNIVEVTIASGIEGTDGSILEDEYSFSFLTACLPNFSSIRKVRIEYGGYISDIEDDTIQLNILEASLEANELTFSTTLNSKVFTHARREWVTCKTALSLLNNISNILLRSKTLGDFSVSYDTNALRDAANKALDCLNKWEPQVISGGYAKTSAQPVGVVKGEYDIDKPVIGRTWAFDSANGDNGFPAGNDKVRNYRRYNKIYNPNKKKYW